MPVLQSSIRDGENSQGGAGNRCAGTHSEQACQMFENRQMRPLALHRIELADQS